MANNIDPALKRAVILKAAMAAFKHRLVSLGLFSTVFKDIPLEGSNDIEVPYYPLVTAASKDYNGTYEFDEGDLESKKITVNKRKYQSLTYTSEEKARQPYFDPEQLGRLKGAKLAEDVLCDILSCVTAENFGAAAVSANADEFDADNVIDLETVCDESDWPDAMRGLIIKSGYLGNLKKNIVSSGGEGNFGFSPIARNLPDLFGFKLSKFNRIPNSAEKLSGFAVYPSAILVALSPVTPAAEVRRALSSYETYTDPETNLTLEYRAWGDPDTDSARAIIECNYGYAPGERAALKRICASN